MITSALNVKYTIAELLCSLSSMLRAVVQFLNFPAAFLLSLLPFTSFTLSFLFFFSPFFPVAPCQFLFSHKPLSSVSDLSLSDPLPLFYSRPPSLLFYFYSYMYKIIPAAPLTSISMIGLIFRFRDKNNTPPKIATAPISSDSFIVFKSGSPVPKKESNMIVAAADTINPREAAFNPLSVSKI